MDVDEIDPILQKALDRGMELTNATSGSVALRSRRDDDLQIMVRNGPMIEPQSELAVPLLYDGHLIGVATFQFDHAKQIADDDRLRLHALLEHAAVLVQRARFRRAGEIVAKAVSLRGEISELSADILAALTSITDARHGIMGDDATNLSAPIPRAAEATIRDALSTQRVTVSEPLDGAVRAIAIPLGDRDFALLLIGEDDVLFPEEEQFLRVLAAMTGFALRQAAALNERDALFARTREHAQLLSAAELMIGMSHDTNNALSNVISAFGFIRERINAQADQALLTGLRDVEDGLSRLHGYYSEIRMMARYGSPVFELHNLEAIVDDSLTLVGYRISQARIRVKRQSGENVSVRCDREGLVQVLLNLLINAIEAMKPHGTLFVGIAKHGDGGAEIRVTDDGHGIDPSLRHDIFNPFFTTKRHGTGTGLAVCKHVVEETHGGRLDFESRRGKGTTFYVRLLSVPPS